MTGLRLKEGVELQSLLRQAGLTHTHTPTHTLTHNIIHACERAVLPFISQGAVFMEREGGTSLLPPSDFQDTPTHTHTHAHTPTKKTRIVLTDPQGFLLSNEIISEIFAAVQNVFEKADKEEEKEKEKKKNSNDKGKGTAAEGEKKKKKKVD
jgi:hypothetical protein